MVESKLHQKVDEQQAKIEQLNFEIAKLKSKDRIQSPQNK